MNYRGCVIFLLVASCGDDGGGTESEATGTGGSSTTSTSSTTTGMSTSGSSSESSSSGMPETTSESSGGSSTTSTSETDTDTESTGGGCGAITDERMCLDAGCAWIGPSGSGDCVPQGDMCKGVMFEMQCNFIPGCQWSEEKMACLPGM